MDCLSSCGVNYSVDDIIKKLLAAEQIALTAESVTGKYRCKRKKRIYLTRVAHS